MEALVRVIAQLVTALAATAFAHFGVTLKAPPQPKPDQIIRRVPVSDPAPPATSAVRDAPRLILAKTERT